LGQLFGKLELTFTTTHCRTTLSGWSVKARYLVLAKNASSVATLGEDGTISHIHFDGAGFWISVGPFREFFKRVKPPGKRLQPTAATGTRRGRRGGKRSR
jgi:hypothetical protein